MASQYFEVQEPLQIMYSMLPQKENIGSPHRLLLWYVYGVCNDDMLRAGKLREWKQGADFHQGLGVWLVKFPETKCIKPLSRATSTDFWII
jgi:hypothetical protein